MIRGVRCGYWDFGDGETAQVSFEAKVLRDSQNAAAYARNCYGGSIVDALKCNMYATPYIEWAGEEEADCPFKNGICCENNTYRMDTGFMDSHHDLGINTPERERFRCLVSGAMLTSTIARECLSGIMARRPLPITLLPIL